MKFRIVLRIGLALGLLLLGVVTGWAAEPATQAVTAVVQEAPASEPAAAMEEAFDFGDFADLDLSALLDADVASASGKVQSISEAPAVIEVITADQIRAWGASNLLEIMQNVVGATVAGGYVGDYFVGFRLVSRDHWDSRTLLLVDGFPLYEIANGGMIHDLVPINAIDRIEVIRGPAGVMFGTNAFSGVINIITRKYEDNGGDVAAAFGSSFEDTSRPFVDGTNRLTGEGRASGRYVGEQGYVQFHGQYLRTPRWNSYAPETADLDANGNPRDWHYPTGFTTASINLQGGWHKGDNELLVHAGYMHQQNLAWGIQPLAGIDPLDRNRHSLFGYLEYKRSWGAFSLRTKGGYIQDTMVARIGLFPAPDQPDFELGGFTGADRVIYWDRDASRGDLDIRGSYDFGPFLLTAGYNLNMHIFRSYQLRFADQPDGTPGWLIPSMPHLKYDTFALDSNVMLEGIWNTTEWLDLIGGLRFANFIPAAIRPDLAAPENDFSVNPRAGAIVKVNESNTIKFLYGRAFRYPSLFERFAEAFAIITASPNLKPEVIDSWEVAYDTRPVDGLSLRANAFINHITDEIINVPSGDGAVLNVNLEGSLYYGFEFLGRYVLSEWTDARVTFGYIEGYEDWKKGDAFDCRASGNCRYIDDLSQYTATVGISLFALDRTLTLTPIYRYASKTASASARHTLDATAEYRFVEGMSVGFVGKNLTNRRFLEPEWSDELAVPQGAIRNQPITMSLWYRAEF